MGAQQTIALQQAQKSSKKDISPTDSESTQSGSHSQAESSGSAFQSRSASLASTDDCTSQKVNQTTQQGQNVKYYLNEQVPRQQQSTTINESQSMVHSAAGPGSHYALPSATQKIQHCYPNHQFGNQCYVNPSSHFASTGQVRSGHQGMYTGPPGTVFNPATQINQQSRETPRGFRAPQHVRRSRFSAYGNNDCAQSTMTNNGGSSETEFWEPAAQDSKSTCDQLFQRNLKGMERLGSQNNWKLKQVQ